MTIKNFEFKVKVSEISTYEQKLLVLNPEFKGTDHQVDTYFKVDQGRLKLREGNIENALIQYERENIADSKLSDIRLFKFAPDNALKQILQMHLPTAQVVDKIRKIYFIGNVKFHFDDVKRLGHFIEVEAIDQSGQFSADQLKEQCDYYFDFFGFSKEMMMKESYSDML